jgi:hypothetical protein
MIKETNVTTLNESEQPEIISDSDYKETLSNKIGSLAMAFNMLKTELSKIRGAENDR